MEAPGKIRSWWSKARRWSRAECLAGAACALTALGLLAWAWRLWPEWRTNPDLSHGFFALPIVVLLWRRAAERGAATDKRALGVTAQAALIGVFGLALLVLCPLATVYAVAMGWDAVPTLFLLSAAAAGAAVLASALAAGEDVRWISPGWVALTIPLVLVLSAPLPPGTYARLTLGLQEFITSGVVDTLRLFGVPAMRAGNVIHLGTTSVGVEEACSGVRSLVSCVLAGIVLSALMLRSPARRAVLVLVAAPLALLTNFFRSLALTLLARNGVDIAGAWHDWLGFAVLGVTTALLAWIASTLEAGDAAAATAAAGVNVEPEAAPDSRSSGSPRPVWIGSGALVILVVAALWLGYVTARTERSVLLAGPVPELARLVPERVAEDWTVTTRGDLDIFSGTLRTEHLLERTYQRRDADGRLTQITAYVAWWPAGRTSVSTVAVHTPESCWPGSGWVMDDAQSERRALELADGRAAAEAEQRVFRHGEYPQRVWFWHLVAGAPFRAFDPLSWRDQLKVFFEHGIRRDEPQAFVRLSTNREWAEIADEPLVAEILAGFAELGVPLEKSK